MIRINVIATYIVEEDTYEEAWHILSAEIEPAYASLVSLEEWGVVRHEVVEDDNQQDSF